MNSNILKASLIHEPYWTMEPTKITSKLENLEANIDLLVVGAGYTGLSAALAAHKIGAKVGVVDAFGAGSGASTRNGGMVGAHPRLSWKILARKFGQTTADQLFNESSRALSFFKNLIVGEEIQCDFEECGRVQLAWTREDFESQKKLAFTTNLI